MGVATDWLRWSDQNGLFPLPEEFQRQRADIAESELERLRAELAKLRQKHSRDAVG